MLADLEEGVRIAGPDDEDALVEAVRAMHRGGDWGLRYSSGAPLCFSEPKTRRVVRNAINPMMRNDGQAWIGIVGDGAEIEGSACLSIGEAFCSEDPLLFENWNFVLPEHRRSDNARRLIAFSTAMSRVLRLPLVIGVMSHVRTDAKCRLYERSFGRPLGALYLYNGDEASDGAPDLMGAEQP